MSNGWYYLINNPKDAGANARDPLAITFSRDGWTFSNPLALRKNAPALRFKGGAKARTVSNTRTRSSMTANCGYSSTNKEDIEISAYPIDAFGIESLRS